MHRSPADRAKSEAEGASKRATHGPAIPARNLIVLSVIPTFMAGLVTWVAAHTPFKSVRRSLDSGAGSGQPGKPQHRQRGVFVWRATDTTQDSLGVLMRLPPQAGLRPRVSGPSPRVTDKPV